VPDAPALAIVLVSFNVRRELEACLRSIAGGVETRAWSITVVDNASSDGTPEMVRATFPAVRIIDAGGNLGFARANNVGIRATASDFVLLLNPDTVVPDGAIDRLVQTLAASSGAAAVGPRLVDADGHGELSFGWTISPLGELRQKIAGRLYERGAPVISSRIERWTRESGERDWISGACLMARRSDLEAVGLLDERYFMYAEDVDLCVAFRRRRRKVLFVADVEVQHLRGRSVGSNPQAAALRRRSQLAYYEKHHPGWAPLLKAYLKLKRR
jgi:GT2 family glycosyltransferase